LPLHILLQPVRAQALAPQSSGVAGAQVPLPSQVRVATYLLSVVHIAAAHCVPEAHFRHWPRPSQAPSCPQLVESALSHSVSGSLPAVTGRQRPFACPVFSDEQA
jgi:hypothetical protein